MTTNKQERKEMPMARGLLDYFPDALAYVAHVSFVGNEQHNPGQDMHWAREKSTDHADCVIRHIAERGKLDDDKLRHSGKAAWRALALLQLELEAAEGKPATPYTVVLGEIRKSVYGSNYTWTAIKYDPHEEKGVMIQASDTGYIANESVEDWLKRPLA